MTLQRNQSNRKRAVSGFLCLVLGVALLQGCKGNPNVANSAATEETTITEATTELTEPATIETEPTTITVEPDETVLEWRILSPEVMEREIEKLQITPDNEKYCYSTFFTILFYDANGEYKVMMATMGGSGNCYILYDLFTGTKLFEYYSYAQNELDNMIKENVEIHNENPYFTGATNITVDVGMEMLNTCIKMGAEYKEEVYLAYFPSDEFYSNEIYFTLKEMAEIYITFTPEQFRVTAADLGVE